MSGNAAISYAGPGQLPVGSQTSARFAYTNQALAGHAHRQEARRAERRAGPLAVAPACVGGWPSPEPGVVGDAPAGHPSPAMSKPVDVSCGFQVGYV